MQGFSMNVSQQQQQSQHMKMNPQMLQSLSLLTMNAAELRDYIYEETQRNPALEITKDALMETISVNKKLSGNSENIRLSSNSSGNTTESDNFQAFIESTPQTEETLQNHLIEQYRLLVSDPVELRLAEKIIGNLDTRGYHITPPKSLLDPSEPEETEDLLQRCIQHIRELDPPGCAVSDVQETLLIQAELKQDAPPLALYILNGHLDILEKPRVPLILKKLKVFTEQNKADPLKISAPPEPLREETVIEAVDFIKKLDPFPARQFASGTTAYISPDIRVSKIPAEDDRGQNTWQFEVEMTRGVFPEIALSPLFKELAESNICKNESEKQGRKFAKESVREAQWFITAVNQRESTILKTARAIVTAQRAFFESGPRALSPLRMKDIAQTVGVHETTISRIANGKYLQCEWGIFEIKYFFSSEVAQIPSKIRTTIINVTQNTSQELRNDNDHTDAISPVHANIPLSKESVKIELKMLIEEHRKAYPEAKPLSDQKLSELLAQRGIQAARRTVTKYRLELNIDSSFDRK